MLAQRVPKAQLRCNLGCYTCRHRPSQERYLNYHSLAHSSTPSTSKNACRRRPPRMDSKSLMLACYLLGEQASFACSHNSSIVSPVRGPRQASRPWGSRDWPLNCLLLRRWLLPSSWLRVLFYLAPTGLPHSGWLSVSHCCVSPLST